MSEPSDLVSGYRGPNAAVRNVQVTETSNWLIIDSLAFQHARIPVISALSIALPESCRILAVVGPSGVGKSTLLALLAGHLFPEMGSIHVCGQVVTGPDPSRPMVFQDHNLFPWMNVIGNVGFGLKCLGVARAERERRALGLLQLMGLEGASNALPGTLSGGMRQRVGLARALAVEPKCLLLDEPFQSLDTTTRQSVRGEFLDIIRRRGVHSVIVTHDLDEAALLADCVLVMHAAGCYEIAVWGGPDISLNSRSHQLRELIRTGPAQ